MHHCKCGCTLISICIDSAPYLPLQQLALLPLLEHLVALQEGPPPLGGGNNPVEQRPLLDGPRRGPPGGLRRRSRLLQMALQLLDGVLPSEGWVCVDQCRSRLLQMALQLLDGVLPSEGWVCGCERGGCVDVRGVGV
eukprot:535462-Prorocentrum_minimum.AAC.1